MQEGRHETVDSRLGGKGAFVDGQASPTDLCC